MKKLTYKRKLYLLRRARREFKKKIKRRNKYYTPSVLFIREVLRKNPKFERINAPKNLTLRYNHVITVLIFIRKIKRLGNKGYFIELNLEGVEIIAEGAISMLLSVIEDLGDQGIVFRGNKPKDKTAKDILERSGFFNHIKGFVAEENTGTKNRILKTGNKDTHQRELVPEIHKAMETVWGSKARCPSLYGGIGEMMRNTCDHAFNKNQKITWHLGISHAKNTVKFSFVDNGEGIIKTSFKKDFVAKLANFFNDNADLLETAFRDGINSRTGLSWRGKGLPTIFEMYSDKIITNLVIITNDVYINFDKKICTTTKVDFSGTYYFWEVDASCKQASFPVKTKN